VAKETIGDGGGRKYGGKYKNPIVAKETIGDGVGRKYFF